MVKINFECMIAGEKLSGSFVTDDENGKSFILSKHKEKIIKDVINNKFKGVSSKYVVQCINWVKWLRLNKSEFYLMVDKLERDIIKGA